MKESHGTKKLIERMAKDSKLPKSIMKEVMACFVDAVKAEIEEGYSVRINGLCTIQIHDRKAFKRYVPTLNTEVDLPAQKVLKFKQLKSLKESVAKLNEND